MAFAFETPSALDYFATLVATDQGFPLLEATVAIAQDEYPLLDVQQVLADVDVLLDRLKRRIPADVPALQKIQILNRFFFQDLGFGGNVNHYYDPANSYLHGVMRTRRGIPITLAVVWLELAQGVGLAARGVDFPGHFMVKVNLPQGQVVIDPFTGRSLSREDLSERLEPFRRQQGLVDDFDVPVGLYLQAAPPRDILARVLRNLKEVYRSQDDAQRLLQVLNRLVVLLPDDWVERRDRGLVWADLGHADKAVADLEIYLTQADGPLDMDVIDQRLQELRRAL